MSKRKCSSYIFFWRILVVLLRFACTTSQLIVVTESSTTTFMHARSTAENTGQVQQPQESSQLTLQPASLSQIGTSYLETSAVLQPSIELSPSPAAGNTAATNPWAPVSEGLAQCLARQWPAWSSAPTGAANGCTRMLNKLLHPENIKTLIQQRISNTPPGLAVDLRGICNYTVICDPPGKVELRGTVQCEPLEVVAGWGVRWTSPPPPDLQYPFTIHRWFHNDMRNRNSISVSSMPVRDYSPSCSKLEGKAASRHHRGICYSDTSGQLMSWTTEDNSAVPSPAPTSAAAMAPATGAAVVVEYAPGARKILAASSRKLRGSGAVDAKDERDASRQQQGHRQGKGGKRLHAVSTSLAMQTPKDEANRRSEASGLRWPAARAMRLPAWDMQHWGHTWWLPRAGGRTGEDVRGDGVQLGGAGDLGGLSREAFQVESGGKDRDGGGLHVDGGSRRWLLGLLTIGQAIIPSYTTTTMGSYTASFTSFPSVSASTLLTW